MTGVAESREPGARPALSTRAAFVALVGALVGCGGGAGTALAGAPLTGVLAVSLSSTHACALVEGGAARCWGGDVFQQLGDGQMTYGVQTPVAVPGLSGLVEVVAGYGYSCAVLAGGSVQCWGSDIWNQIGDEAPDGGTRHFSVAVPTPVAGLGPAVDHLATAGAARGGGAYTCAHLTDGTVQCWGENVLGFAGPTALSTPPTTIPGLAHVRVMALGGVVACFALEDGTVSCMGLGPLGRADVTSSASPLAVPGLSGVKSVAAGEIHVCALLQDGTVWCWSDGAPTPTPVPGLATATAIAGGGYQTCALLADGGVACWSYEAPDKPALVAGLGVASAVSVGGDVACAVIKGGTVECWGSDEAGRLGNGVMPKIGEPRVVTTPVTVVAPGDGGA